ncbi:DMT family transporter [Caldisalinibacter kiritimatiensis]|uniref:Permease of the drug/metabolite transporter (DMT) superfamily n=1 Tax=Caldisalinibacter kiritimatiensis TaxID=1304284 RepID=R1CSC6_9FIRM|nr:DMT family transporter [Caldisalinibacter kiritimatiensis]EOC99608.1 Permease of the drug/metabolite transporter (DMT) superfamily [Caldisalinibacter kiritimatiensis]
MKKQLKADLALLLVTVVWGTTFVITKNALKDIPTYNFLSLRFILAFLFSAIFFYKNMKNTNTKTLLYGTLIGSVLFAGYAFQTLGLNYTTASKSGFITGFSVVIVPIVSALLLKRMPKGSSIIGVLFAIVGLGLMTLNTDLTFNIGDFYTLLCAFAFAFHIILVGKYTTQVDSIALAVIQIGVVGVLSLIFSFTTSKPFIIPTTTDIWIGIFITGILATSGAYIIQNTMQKFTSPTHTALIYTAEPVFSAIFAFILLGEVMSTKGIIGSILIVMGMILAEI